MRACYGFTMRLWIGGVETLVPARWYWADQNAQPWDGPHGCEASPWLKDGEKNLWWGEVAGPKTLDRGVNYGYLGQCSVGDPQWFVDGQLPADFYSLPGGALPGCCGPALAPDTALPLACYPAYPSTLYLTFTAGPSCLTDLGSIAGGFGYGLSWQWTLPPSCGAEFGQTITLQTSPDPCGATPVLVISDDGTCFGTQPWSGPAAGMTCSPFTITYEGVTLISTGPLYGSGTCPGGTCSFTISE